MSLWIATKLAGIPALSLGQIRWGLLGTEKGDGGHLSEAFDVGFQGGVKFAQYGLNLSAFRCDGASTQLPNFGLRGHRRKQDVTKFEHFLYRKLPSPNVPCRVAGMDVNIVRN